MAQAADSVVDEVAVQAQVPDAELAEVVALAADAELASEPDEAEA